MRNKLWLGSLAMTAVALWAQDNPPSRVARLNLIQGQVSFQPPTLTDWAPATLNYPVTIGDHLYADADSRAELHIGSTAIRLGPTSSMSFLNLNDKLVQIRLDQGAIIVRVKYLEADDACEIDTAQGAVAILGPGEYRVDTDPDRNVTMLTVRDGEAAVTSDAGGFPVHAHQTAVVPADGKTQIQTENPQNAFDVFAVQQDREDDSMGLPRYVAREMPGWQDLDRSGMWSQDPTYGPVWRPTAGIETGWAPYRDGHWAWVGPWGWTWIDDAPWGFAPFHYGRWALVSKVWVWVPGLMPPTPIYAPALVAFATINGVSTGGGVAWFPLGPKEIFVPSYAATPLYVDRINVTTVNINNVAVVNHDYMNQTAAGMTVVDGRTFVEALPVRKAIVKVPPEAIAHAGIARTPDATPQRASLVARAGPPVDAPHPPAGVMQRTVFAHHAPPTATTAPMIAKQPVTPAKPNAPVDSPAANQHATVPLPAPLPAAAVKTLPPPPATARPAAPPPAAAPSAPGSRAAEADLAPGQRPKIPRPEKPPVERVKAAPKPAVPDHPLTKEEKAIEAKKKREADRQKAEQNDR